VGTQPEHSARSQHQGEHSDFFRNTFEAPRDITTQHATSYKAVVPRPAQGSREVTPSNGEGALSDVVTHNDRESVNDGKKRHKQCLQGAMTTTDHGNKNNGEAGGSGMRRILIAARSDSRHARPPMDHFKRLLEEVCPNHAYPVRHRLKDCNMMRSFMTSGSLTWDAELNKGLDGSDTTPFIGENVVQTVYGGCPPLGRRRVSKLSPRALTHCG
jgi:hypothetical protein